VIDDLGGTVYPVYTLETARALLQSQVGCAAAIANWCVHLSPRSNGCLMSWPERLQILHHAHTVGVSEPGLQLAKSLALCLGALSLRHIHDGAYDFSGFARIIVTRYEMA